MKNFRNRPNTPHKIGDRIVWESRSVAVSCVILAILDDEMFVLSGKRGKLMPQSAGMWNVPCGYLDYDEDSTEAAQREVYEETGLDLDEHEIIINNLDTPWFVVSNPTEVLQNVTLRHGCVILVNELPKLTSEHAEPNEVEELKWIPLNEVDNYEWAFNHSNVIKKYVDLVIN